ncbi:MAG: alpha/beta hydrolase-fold protein [Bdellovibrionota bacterium]|nr:alpha/beta hydrolase-fold protein [Bdellovibrionota bacterium]
MKVLFLFFVFSFHTFASLERPVLESTCEETDTDRLTWNTCVIKTKDSKSKDVIYYFHGKDGDEKTWLENYSVTGMLRDYWQENNIDAPTVVTVSFGPIWLLVRNNGTATGGLLELVSGKILPELNSRFANEGKRILLGQSMGGFNAMQLYLEDSLRFDKAAFICPAIGQLSPFASDEEVLDYIQRTKASPDKVSDLIRLSKMFIPDLGFWKKTSPLILADKVLGEESSPIYLSASLEDDYGFYEGSLLFKNILKGKGVEINWRPLSGKHCSHDVISLGNFLTEG